MTITGAQFDAHWMPFTGNRQFKKDPRIIVEAEGRYYKDSNGRKIFDGLSGLWTCGLGHKVTKINEAIKEQIDTLDFSPSFQFGHPKSFQLAELITSFSPKGLDRVFFTGSGSDAVETALKIARAYWVNKGLPSKSAFIGRIKGYHGVNFGGISVGGIETNRKMFGELLSANHLRETITPQNIFSKGQPMEGACLAEELEDIICSLGAENVAAVILEPMSGSAGVIPPPKGYLERIRSICDAHEVLLIFDEVICGLGRLGWASGSEAFGVTPDIMTIAKQLTNGVVPMGAAIVKSSIHDVFMDSNLPHYMLEFPHGYTYSAHPVACAAGLASLSLLKEEDVFNRVREIAPYFEARIHELRQYSVVKDIRNFGLAGGITLEHYPAEPARRPFEIAMSMWDKGQYVRYGGDTIQIAPAFAVLEDELDRLFESLEESLKKF